MSVAWVRIRKLCQFKFVALAFVVSWKYNIVHFLHQRRRTMFSLSVFQCLLLSFLPLTYHQRICQDTTNNADETGFLEQIGANFPTNEDRRLMGMSGTMKTTSKSTKAPTAKMEKEGDDNDNEQAYQGAIYEKEGAEEKEI